AWEEGLAPLESSGRSASLLATSTCMASSLRRSVHVHNVIDDGALLLAGRRGVDRAQSTAIQRPFAVNDEAILVMAARHTQLHHPADSISTHRNLAVPVHERAADEYRLRVGFRPAQHDRVQRLQLALPAAGAHRALSRQRQQTNGRPEGIGRGGGDVIGNRQRRDFRARRVLLGRTSDSGSGGRDNLRTRPVSHAQTQLILARLAEAHFQLGTSTTRGTLCQWWVFQEIDRLRLASSQCAYDHTLIVLRITKDQAECLLLGSSWRSREGIEDITVVSRIYRSIHLLQVDAAPTAREVRRAIVSSAGGFSVRRRRRRGESPREYGTWRGGRCRRNIGRLARLRALSRRQSDRITVQNLQPSFSTLPGCSSIGGAVCIGISTIDSTLLLPKMSRIDPGPFLGLAAASDRFFVDSTRCTCTGSDILTLNLGGRSSNPI
ncbi:hypothetical protein PENTCL1PPCAC_19966, partial [Pristionchus entomophagus]